MGGREREVMGAMNGSYNYLDIAIDSEIVSWLME